MHAWTLLFCLALQETREGDTVRYKGFAEILQEIARTVEKSGEKTLVVWLIDNASMLRDSRHGELLAEAIPRTFGPGFHAVFAMGEEPRLLLKATDDRARVARAIEGLAAENPDDRIKNGLLNVRGAAKYASGYSGKKFLVLFTQENGDNEDHLEATAKFLKEAGVVFFPISGEAVYSDPYWESLLEGSGSQNDSYRRLKFQLRGQEAAYIEFPYGWPLVWNDPAYTVPSGHGYYGLSRLATQSGGRYYLYHVDRSAFSFCQQHGCALCSGGHKDCGGAFDVTKLKMTAPDIGSRDQVRERLGRERLFGTMLAMWERLHRSGLLRGAPRLKFASGRLQEVKPSSSGGSLLLFGSDWKSNQGQALRAAGDLEKTAAEFAVALEQEGPTADKRVQGTADAFWLHLRILRLNLVQLAAFCEEMDRVVRSRRPADPDLASPLLDEFAGAKILGYSLRPFYLCHGGSPLKDVHFLGGEAVEKETHEVLERADRLIEKHQGTPWEILLRRAALMVYVPTVDTREGRNQRERPRSGSDESATDSGGPTRPGRNTTSGGSGGGTATGD